MADKYYDELVEVSMPRRLAIKLKNILAKNPDADIAEVKHGHWIKVGKTEGRANILQCSVCGKVRRGIAKTPYCKDCGAKMDEREDKQHDNN
jgi:hypothetical protein